MKGRSDVRKTWAKNLLANAGEGLHPVRLRDEGGVGGGFTHARSKPGGTRVSGVDVRSLESGRLRPHVGNDAFASCESGRCVAAIALAMNESASSSSAKRRASARKQTASRTPSVHGRLREAMNVEMFRRNEALTRLPRLGGGAARC